MFFWPKRYASTVINNFRQRRETDADSPPAIFVIIFGP
jgi:hypothetical protein